MISLLVRAFATAFLGAALALNGGCDKGNAVPASAASAPQLPIQAGAYKMLGPIFNGRMVVETHYYRHGNSYGMFFGCGSNQTCFIPDFASTPQQATGKLVFPDACRFSHPFFYQGATYLACNDSRPGDGDIYLYRSTDLLNWTIQNKGNPILRRRPGTQWAHIWNVAILPVGTRWHMLAESHSDLTGMDLAYAWADPGKSMDFTPREGPVVIPHGGNPELHLIDGKMVALHGMYHDRSAADPWYVTMSIADPADPTVWTVRRDKLMIEQTGIDIADPSYIEIGGLARINVSYDQNKVVELEGPILTAN